ncbi:ABC transporter substrate-binding protein [Phytoactinopolyspora halotolerans]|uniref:ABC transporter substrate-binding protein n=1 Tax=Phytoactinopolyspora halotolerans TaxID=1981512 RepID=A0A6L9S9R6_9ACTN|nr:ABC transporter substrate-binding protein [Phytoactinopolyspora halotolerans]NEE01268.1 ABC transporter substrate-binding protein [Phytoactinopolyspora halotolerans]
MQRTLTAAAVAASLMLAACGGDDDSADAPTDSDGAGNAESGELTPVNVGVIPIVDVAPIYLGIEQGFFAEHGLDVTPVSAQGGAAIVPGVTSGEFQFGFSNVTSLLIAAAQGLELQMVAPGNSSTGEPGEDFAAIVTQPDSGISSAADLEGRTVAANTLNNIVDSTTREVVRLDGGDPSAVEFVEIAFPDMPAALANGQVDAAFVLEPFLSMTLQDGAVPVASPYAETDPDLMIAAYFTSAQYAAEEPETVDAFVSAMQESLAYAEENPEEAREMLGTYTEIDAELREMLVLPRFEPEINQDTVQLLADLAEGDGLLDQPVDVSELIR